MPEAAVVPHFKKMCKNGSGPDKELTATIKWKRRKKSQCESG